MKQQVVEAFQQIGARASVSKVSWKSFRGMSAPVSVGRFGDFALDIRSDSVGELFDLTFRSEDQVDVLDVQPGDAHLLLRVGSRLREEPGTFLCGHDEKHWFIAAVPEREKVRSVQQAKDALKPAEVWESMQEHPVPMTHRDRRKTAAFVRQGEWFFIPRPEADFRRRDVLRYEPIRRGAGKPHVCQFVYRYGGETVYVNHDHPDGLTLKEFQNLPKAQRNSWDFREMRRGAKVFARGSVAHPDHETICLREWHEVVLNRESEAAAMEQVAFLD
jgi:hypothetical protein